jgi:hypothetical protein
MLCTCCCTCCTHRSMNPDDRPTFHELRLMLEDGRARKPSTSTVDTAAQVSESLKSNYSSGGSSMSKVGGRVEWSKVGERVRRSGGKGDIRRTPTQLFLVFANPSGVSSPPPQSSHRPTDHEGDPSYPPVVHRACTIWNESSAATISYLWDAMLVLATCS